MINRIFDLQQFTVADITKPLERDILGESGHPGA